MNAESRPEEMTGETGKDGGDERAGRRESGPWGSAGGSDDAEPVLYVEGLSRSFGELEVLEDVSFSLSRGEVGAIVGPNGSGKSTLLRALAGLSPHGGTVEVSADGPRTVGYLPQSPAFRPRFTVRETLSFYADLLPGEVDAAAALDRVGMIAAADRRTEALSGGMRRLLGIAQATLGDPPLVLLDEPTSDLDPRMTDHIFGVIEDIVDRGATVLLATHDHRGVDRSDRTFLLDEGRIVVSGTPDDLRGEADSALDALFADYVTDPTAELTVRTGGSSSMRGEGTPDGGDSPRGEDIGGDEGDGERGEDP
jgi:ABC-type multidrug transport system ATPase subunit